jgi:hypothetical protein
MGWIDIETDRLVEHLGEEAAREIVRLSQLPSVAGISQEAFDFLEQRLAQRTPRLRGMFGAPSMAREAIDALRRRFDGVAGWPSDRPALR